MRATLTHLIGPYKGKRERFDAERITIGRAADNALCFNDGQRRVSSHHAEIVLRDDHYLLRDLGSTNGTMINGRRVVASEIQHDDLIEFGAGGPLLRFGVEEDYGDAGAPDSQKDYRQSASPGQPAHGKRSEAAARSPHRKANGLLLAAIATAMLVGAIGGIFLSARFPNRYEEEMSFAKVAEFNRPAVVFIRAEFELTDESGQTVVTDARTGSGFIVSSSGLIVTNRHVIRDWEYNSAAQGMTGRTTKIEVILPGQQREQAITAEVHRLGDENDPDVAILKINMPRLRFVRGIEGNLDKINQGEDVAVIGYPFGLDLLKQTNDEQVSPSLATGIVSRVGHDYIQLNLRAYHGNSGGPVLNRKGEVIGILTANVGGAQDIALCTPINAALELINNPASRADSSLQEGTRHVK
ncbi:MAG TPA: trypsin-like peptidase domain-containing protein [Blastocatellia bacterium]|nr:trypsin-like peptidase domain-containing protein [Blastocatellia bacterium]